MSDLRLFDPDTPFDQPAADDGRHETTGQISDAVDPEPSSSNPIYPDPVYPNPIYIATDSTAGTGTPPGIQLPVEVVRSTRRRRTISAQMHAGVLRVSIPNWMSPDEERTSVQDMVRRFTRRLAARDIDLGKRARMLARTHDLRSPARIEWSESLSAVWGLCTPSDSHIRLSTRLVGFPLWVLDYVIVHELAHLHVSGHGPDFWDLARRYPRAERAIGFLLAKSGDDPDDEEQW